MRRIAVVFVLNRQGWNTRPPFVEQFGKPRPATDGGEYQGTAAGEDCAVE